MHKKNPFVEFFFKNFPLWVINIMAVVCGIGMIYMIFIVMMMISSGVSELPYAISILIGLCILCPTIAVQYLLIQSLWKYLDK